MIDREKIIAALEPLDLEFFSDTALVSALLDKLTRAKADLFEARQSIIKEGMEADRLREEIQQTYRRVRTDPTFSCHGDFYFMDVVGKESYIVTIAGPHNISMCRRSNGIDYMMMRMSPDEFAKQAKS